jgi:hypothetical protein
MAAPSILSGFSRIFLGDRIQWTGGGSGLDQLIRNFLGKLLGCLGNGGGV